MYTIVGNVDTGASNTNGERRSSTDQEEATILNGRRTVNGDVTTDDGGFQEAANQTTRQLTGGDSETIRHRVGGPTGNRRPPTESAGRSSRALEHIEQLEHQQQEEEESNRILLFNYSLHNLNI